MEKKEEKKAVKKEEKKVEKKSIKNLTATSRYKKRGGENIVKKKEKVRQTSVNRNEKGKRHHVTYEVINVLVEKKD